MGHLHGRLVPGGVWVLWTRGPVGPSGPLGPWECAHKGTSLAALSLAVCRSCGLVALWAGGLGTRGRVPMGTSIAA